MRKQKQKKEKEENQKISQETEKKITFLDVKGKEVNLSDVVTIDEITTFQVKRKRDDKEVITAKYVLSYESAKRLARIAGIAMVDQDILVKPSIENKMTTAVCVSFRCANCCHVPFDLLYEKVFTFTKLGEADLDNTSSIASKYKITIAEKRAFVRGVIEHLGLPNMYGEEEFTEDPTQEKKSKEIKTDQSKMLEKLAASGIINKILNAKETEDLEDIAMTIKNEKDKYSKDELDYLRQLLQKQFSKFE